MEYFGKDGQLSKNFHHSEFECRSACEGFRISKDLIKKLQKARDLIGAPLKITSGYRCKDCNTRIGGVEKSRHLLGEAVDILAPYSQDKYLLVKYLTMVGMPSVGIYHTFVHCDVRNADGILWLGQVRR